MIGPVSKTKEVVTILDEFRVTCHLQNSCQLVIIITPQKHDLKAAGSFGFIFILKYHNEKLKKITKKICKTNSSLLEGVDRSVASTFWSFVYKFGHKWHDGSVHNSNS